MNAPDQRPSGLRCAACAKPFGFAVAFCPFCGITQRSAAAASVIPAPAPAPAIAARAEKPPAVSPPVVPPTSVPPVPARAVPAQAGAVQAGAVQPGAVQAGAVQAGAVQAGAVQAGAVLAPKPVSARLRFRSGRRRRSWPVTLGAAGIIVAALLLRPGPSGTVIVYAAPDVPGSVTVDGARAGAPGERLDVLAGPHRLGYDADGWTAAGREIAVHAGQQRVVTLALTAAPATLVFDVLTPGVTLRLDDQPVADPQAERRVAPGRHRLTAARPGYTPFAADLVLGRGEQRSIPVILAPLPARQVTRIATAGVWSEPVMLPAHASFTVSAAARLRLRAGQDVVLLQPGGAVDLGEIHGQSLQVMAVDDQPVEIRVTIKPAS